MSTSPPPPPSTSSPLDPDTKACVGSPIESILEAASNIPVPETPTNTADSDESWTKISPPSDNISNKDTPDGIVDENSCSSDLRDGSGEFGIKMIILDDSDDEASKSDTSVCTALYSPEESGSPTDFPDTPCPPEKQTVPTNDAIFDKCTEFFDAEQATHGAIASPESRGEGDASDLSINLSISQDISETDQLGLNLESLNLQLTKRNNEITKLKRTIQSLKIQRATEKCVLKEAKNTIKIQKSVIKKLTDDQVTFLDRKITLKEVEEIVRDLKYKHDNMMSENYRLRSINEKRNETLKEGIRALGLACAGVVEKVDFNTLSVFLNSLDFEQKSFQSDDNIFTDENIRDIFWIDTPSPTTISAQDIHMDAINFWCGDYTIAESILPVLYLNNNTPDISNLIIDGLSRLIHNNDRDFGDQCDVITFCQLVGILDLRYNIPSFDTLYDTIITSIIPYYTTSPNAIELLYLIHLAAVLAWRRIGVRFTPTTSTDNFVPAVKRLFGGSPPELHEACENLGELLAGLGIKNDVDVTTVDGVAGRIVLRPPNGRWVQLDCVGRSIGYVNLKLDGIEECDVTGIAE